MIIIAETKNGNAFPYKAYACNDEADFIQRIRDTQLQRHSSDELIETADQACTWLNETHAQHTQIITQADYCEGMGDKVDTIAKNIGWLTEENQEQ